MDAIHKSSISDHKQWEREHLVKYEDITSSYVLAICIVTVIADLVDKPSGVTICPRCLGELYWSRALNGHTMGNCFGCNLGWHL